MRALPAMLALLMLDGPAVRVELAAAEPAATAPADVYVSDSFQARQALDRLAELEAEGRWGEAAEGYDRLLVEQGEALVKLSDWHFGRVRDHVRARQQEWPHVARLRYRDIFDHRAERDFERLDAEASPETLLARADRWWLTPSGPRFGELAARRLLQAGRVEAADGVRERAAARGNLPGIDDLDAQIRATRTTRPASAGEAAIRPVPPVVDVAELLWQTRLGGSVDAVDTAGGGDEGDDRALQPAAGGGRVYVQRGRRLYALRLHSGLIEWTFDAWAGPASGDWAPSADRPGRSPVVFDERVYAIMTRPAAGDAGAAATSESVLVCVEGETGRLLWESGAADRDAQSGLRPDEFFDSAPLFHDRYLYVLVRRGRELGYEDCSLACFEPASGRRLWKKLLASGAAFAGADGRTRHTEPAAAGGDVFVQTSVGAVACVEGLTGAIRWLRLEPPDPRRATARMPFAAGPRPTTTPAEPTGATPLLLGRWPAAPGQPHGERCVLAVSAAAGDLWVLSAEDGRPLGRVDRNLLGEYRYLLGFAGSVVYAVGDRVVACDWPNGKRLWTLPPPELDAMSLAGRPLLAADCVLVPTRAGLLRVSLDGTQCNVIAWDTMTRPGDAGAASTSGGATHPPTASVILAGDLLVVCRGGRLFAALPGGAGLPLLLRQVEASPDDPGVWLDLAAYRLLMVHDWAGGVENLDAAIDRAAGAPAATGLELKAEPGRTRGRAFELVLDAASKAGGATASEGHPAGDAASGAASSQPQPSAGTTAETRSAVQLLQRAEALAGGPEQEVRFRLVFARLFEQTDRADAALRLYQQILDRVDLRAWQGVTSGPAGRTVEQRIDELIARAGVRAYAPIESAAAARLRAARREGDASGWKDVLERYPNSAAALEALPIWMDLECQAGRPLQAARFGEDYLRRWSGRLEDRQRSAVVARIALAYAQGGRATDGVAWALRGRRDQPSTRWPVPGGMQDWAGVQTLLQGMNVEPPPAAPDLAGPPEKAWEMRLDPPALVLTPEQQAGMGDIGRSLVLVASGGELLAVDGHSGAVRWRTAPPSPLAPTWIASRGELLLLATRFQLLGVDARDGRVRWSYGQVPPRALSPAVDPEFLPSMAARVAGQTVVAAFFKDGRAAAVEIASGQVLWERKLSRKATGTSAVNDEHLAYVTTADSPVVVVVRADTGREVQVIRPAAEGQIQWCGFTPERSLMMAGNDWLECVDARSARRLWTVEGLRLNRPASLLMDGTGFYALDEARLSRRSWQNGHAAWTRPIAGAEVSMIRTWLGDGGLTVLTRSGPCFVGKDGGEVRAATVPAGEAVVSGWRTGRGVLMVTATEVDVEGEPRRRLSVRWIERGGMAAQGGNLGASTGAAEVVVTPVSLIVRDGPHLTGWRAGPAMR